jgi:hypothetical protein
MVWVLAAAARSAAIIFGDVIAKLACCGSNAGQVRAAEQCAHKRGLQGVPEADSECGTGPNSARSRARSNYQPSRIEKNGPDRMPEPSKFGRKQCRRNVRCPLPPRPLLIPTIAF